MKLKEMKLEYNKYIGYFLHVGVIICGILIWHEWVTAYMKTDYINDTVFNIPKAVIFVMYTSCMGFVDIYTSVLKNVYVLIDEIRDNIKDGDIDG